MKGKHKKTYVEPQCEVIEFKQEDSIATSGNLGAALWENIWGGGDGV